MEKDSSRKILQKWTTVRPSFAGCLRSVLLLRGLWERRKDSIAARCCRWLVGFTPRRDGAVVLL